MITAKLDKLSGREQALIAAAALSVLGYLMDLFVVGRVAGALKTVSQEIEQADLRLDVNKRVLLMERDAKDEFEKEKGKFTVAGAAARASEETRGQIHDLAVRTGVVVVSSEQREPVKGEFADEYAVEIKQFKADIDKLIDFLYELQAAPGMLRVVRLTVSPPPRGEGGLEGAMLITKRMVPGDRAPIAP